MSEHVRQGEKGCMLLLLRGWFCQSVLLGRLHLLVSTVSTPLARLQPRLCHSACLSTNRSSHSRIHFSVSQWDEARIPTGWSVATTTVLTIDDCARYLG